MREGIMFDDTVCVANELGALIGQPAMIIDEGCRPSMIPAAGNMTPKTMLSAQDGQGRFKSFPIDQDDHVLTVLRYVKRNPLRAELVHQSVQWCWSNPSAALPRADWAVERPQQWRSWVDKPQSPAEESALQSSITCGRPFGDEPWAKRTAARLGTDSRLRTRGRPRKW